MSRKSRIWRAIRDAAFVMAGLFALSLAAVLAMAAHGSKTGRLTITAGSFEGVRHHLARSLQVQAATREVVFAFRETSGSEEAAELVDGRLVDVALIQGGLDLRLRPHLRQVATLHVEPLHLLVRGELHADASKRLSALRNKTIGLGEKGSGTHRLALEVLDFAGLRLAPGETSGDFKPTHPSYAQLNAIDDPAQLPDAVFMVSTLPSPVARRLVVRHGYRLVSLPFLEAFALGAFEQRPLDDEHRFGVNRRNVGSTIVPAYTYELEPPVPAEPLPTLGTRLLVVAHEDVDADVVERLVDVIYTSPFGQDTLPTLDLKLLEIPPEIPWHDGTLAYLKRNAPIIAGDVVDLVEKELSILGALAGAAFFLGQWLWRRYLRRRDKGFEAYIVAVNRIERRGIHLEKEPRIDLSELLRLQDDLSNLKGEALEKFADGDIDGEDLMSSFLAHVSDTRDFLTRLILHARSAATEAEIRNLAEHTATG